MGWKQVAMVLPCLLAGCGTAPAAAHPTAVRGPMFSTHNQVRLYPDREALPVLLSMLRNAQRSIHLETFQFFDVGEAPRAIIDVLKQKHLEGLDVRVMVDRLGTEGARSHVVDELRAAGIPTVTYGPYPFAGRTGEGVNFTHRKLYLVDSVRGMTGGMNLGNEFLTSFHDMLWMVEGDAARELHQSFADEWARAGGPRPITLPPAPDAVGGDEPVAVVVTSPQEPLRAREILATLLQGIRVAQRRVDVAYPFLWDERLTAALASAAHRGVQVHVLTTGHDKFGSHELNAEAARKLMAQGVVFRRYATVFAHIKYCAVDDNFLLVGSSNGDSLTFENNQELDLLLIRPSTVADFRARVSDADWARASPLTEADVEIPGYERPATRVLELIQAYL